MDLRGSKAIDEAEDPRYIVVAAFFLPQASELPLNG
jgi:hypothetical protein